MVSFPAHESFFAYNVTRKYPFKWFTWVTVLGGCIAVILFSLVAFAANGFELQAVFTYNPNATLNDEQWFQRPSMAWFSKVEASCQPQFIYIGDKYVTPFTGRVYTIDFIGRMTGQETTRYPSLAYLNNTLEDCLFDRVYLDLDGQGHPSLNSSLWTYSRGKSYAWCRVPGPSGELWVGLYMELAVGYGSPAIGDYCMRLAKHPSNPTVRRGCLEILWSNPVRQNLDFELQDYDGRYRNATGIAAPNTWRGRIMLQRTEIADIQSPDFFMWTFWNEVGVSSDAVATVHAQDISEWAYASTPLPLRAKADIFAKAIYSMTLVDLGQDRHSNAFSNALDAYYIINGYLSLQWNETLGYSDFENDYGTPKLKPATLIMQYACSVPVRKGTGSIIATVVVTDLVLLQALWNVFSWLAGRWLAWKYPGSDQCAGCALRNGNLSYELGSQANLSRPMSNRSGRDLADEEASHPRTNCLDTGPDQTRTSLQRIDSASAGNTRSRCIHQESSS